MVYEYDNNLYVPIESISMCHNCPRGSEAPFITGWRDMEPYIVGKCCIDLMAELNYSAISWKIINPVQKLSIFKQIFKRKNI